MYLEKAGYQAHVAAGGEQMWQVLASTPVDLIILDLMLPGEDGLELCRQLRARRDIPVFMLTARGTLVDRIVGLEVGADDYLPKPFDPRELLARIKVIIRRARSFPEKHEADRIDTISFEVWQLDTRAPDALAAGRDAVAGQLRLPGLAGAAGPSAAHAVARLFA